MVCFFAGLFSGLGLLGIAWLLSWDLDGGYYAYFGASVAMALLVYAYLHRHTLSENIFDKRDRFVWHISFWTISLPLGAVLILVWYAFVLEEWRYWNDNRIGSVKELAERSGDLQGSTLLLDSITFKNDVAELQKDAELDWRTLTDKEGGFTIKFPNMPIIKSGGKMNADGSYTLTKYKADFTDKINVNYDYEITYYNVPDALSITDMFDAMEKSYTTGDVSLVKDAQASGYIARDIRTNDDDHIQYTRLAYYRSTLYIIRVVAPASDVDNESVAFFFNSFQPL
ncbi:MAG: hypothetical protein JST49_15755 [Bacteroidetes bacterium]|nr:hypothetical protein [Bacteroidota bacterium]